MPEDLTRLLNTLKAGEPCDDEELLQGVYQELRRLALSRMARQAPGQTLQATALVHEAYLKLMGQPGQPWENRRHFFGSAARAMQQVLVDIARRKKARRSEFLAGAILLDAQEVAHLDPDSHLRLYDALDELGRLNPIEAEIVRLRFFVGLENGEIAGLTGLSLRSVERHWAFAKAWLFHALQGTTNLSEIARSSPGAQPAPQSES